MEKQKKSKYKIDINIGGESYHAEDRDLSAAFASLPVNPKNITGKGIFKIYYGDKTFEKLFTVPLVRRFFANKDNRQWWINNFIFLTK